MFQKLVVAVDKSDPSDRAVAAALALAQASGGSVHLIHIVEHVAVPQGRFTTGYDLEDPDEAHQLLATELASLTGAGIVATASVVEGRAGHAAQEIVDSAKAEGADVIVMGCRGRSELSALVLGSTAFKVLHATDRPVLIVP